MKTKKIVWLFAIAIFAFISLNVSVLNASVSKKDEIIYRSSVDLAKYPNSSAIVLYNYTKLLIHKDMSYKKTRRIVIKILDYRGKKENAEKRIYFDKRYEKVHIGRAITVKEDANKFEVIPAYKNAIRILDAPYEAGFMNYAVHKMEVVAFSNVDKGNIVDLTYSLSSNKDQPFSDKVFFGYREPVHEMHYEIVVPKSMKIKFNRMKGPMFKEKIVGKNRILIWNAENLPQIIREHNMPEKDFIVPTLYYSLYKNWKQFRNNLLKQYNKNIKVTPEIKILVKKIISKDKNKMQKVKKISHFLAKRIANKNIRDLETFKIRPVDKIIASGYAASFDRIALFLSMMKSIGMNGYPVAIGPELLYWNNEKNAVQTEDFTKIIAKVNINGKEYYVDPSNEFYPIGYVGNENRTGMIIAPGKVQFTPILNKGKFENQEKICYTISISKNGEAKILDKHTFWGNEAVRMRSRYRYMTPIQKMQDYQGILGNISEDVEPISKTMTIDLNYPVKISYAYNYKNYAVKEGNYVYFDIPSKLVPFELNKSPQQKQYPFVSIKNDRVYYYINIKYPSFLNPVIMPHNIHLKNNVFSVNRTVKAKKGELEIKDTIIKKYGLVKKTSYTDFYTKVMELSRPKYYKILLKDKNAL